MNHYQSHHMLVTGGAGFIGSNFIRYVLMHEPTIKIINIDKLTYAGSLTNLKNLDSPNRYHFCQGDIIDSNLVHQILRNYSIDTIVHFAAESHVDRSITEPNSFVETNLLGTFTLLEAARQQWFTVENRSMTQCRFHHISTDEVYGSLKSADKPFNEQTTYQPRSPYSATKAGSDHLVFAYYHTYGLPITLSHCSNNYGPRQHAEKFIPTIIHSCLAKQTIPIYGNGKNIRDWLYVDDHCSGILAILKNGKIGETYNMGGDNEWENITLAQYICEQMEKHVPNKIAYQALLNYVTDRPGHDFRYAIDSHKIKTELNWLPLVSMEAGINKTIEYYSQSR
ncbi:MAG: dTDP-glucose 4,6-dehydratase [Gammaproteobacteria bacterium RIFCSPHIGHO2_12_FULL_37_14]|nr:MAG: dTDP-glucose 4,6-dehydratase [Gammaproteobacteria bacterium RIFCSPHIGHO2_12_FULL_37_14]